MEIITRKEKVRWGDILIGQRDDDVWTYENATVTAPTDSPAKPLIQSVTIGGTWTAAKPAIYTVQIGGTWTASDTLTIGSTTFTAAADPTGNQFSAGGSGAVIVEDLQAAGLAVTGFTIACDGDTITLTQTVPGTGNAPTVSNTGTAGTAVLAKTQNYKAGDTITISGTTYTCVEGASTATGTVQFEPTATSEEIVEIIVTDPLTITNFTITRDGAKVIIAQTTAGTGTALTNSNVSISGTTGKAVLATVQTAEAAVVGGGQYDLVPGDPVCLVSTSSDGKRTVKPVNTTVANDVSAFVGFCRDCGTVANGKTETVVIVTAPCRLDKKNLPAKDAFGNVIVWSATDTGTVGKAAFDKGFRFGENIVGG